MLPYDRSAAVIHARRGAGCEGVPPSHVNEQIAAVAVTHAAATRNAEDFERFPALRVDNWFEAYVFRYLNPVSS